METLRSRILGLLNENPARQYTNGDIAYYLSVPEASVRRMTLDLISRGDIMTDGASAQPYVYFAVPVPAPSSPEAPKNIVWSE
jgi:hypothetical protein